MKRILKICFFSLLAFFVCALVRSGMRKFTPKIYAGIWGSRDLDREIEKVSPVNARLEAADRRVSPRGETTIVPRQAERVDQDKGPEIYATGRVWKGTNVLVVMSDGTVRSMDDNTDPEHIRVERIRKHFMDFDGKRYWYKPHESAAPTGALGSGAAPARPQAVERTEPASTTTVAAGDAVGPGPASSDNVARQQPAFVPIQRTPARPRSPLPVAPVQPVRRS